MFWISSMKSNRLDYMVALRFNLSRSHALDQIKQGNIKVNDTIISKPSYAVKENDILKLSHDQHFVSRGGYKLEAVLIETNCLIKGKDCLDVGASTGGFTHCLLNHEAASVVTIDVGSNQLHPTIQNHLHVQWHENTNINDVKPSDYPFGFDIIVVDVSFTTLKHVFLAIHHLLKANGSIFLLFKPQFEVGKEYLNKKGIVKQQSIVNQLLSDYVTYFQTFKYPNIQVIPCQLKGKQGNQEYFIYLSR